MTKAEKLRERILGRPTPADIRNDELKLFLLQIGMIEVRVGNCMHKAHGASPVNRTALRDVVAQLRKMGLVEKDNG
jgi:hypothetical protein